MHVWMFVCDTNMHVWMFVCDTNMHVWMLKIWLRTYLYKFVYIDK